MKIHILYDFTEEAWGGGNQFLKALRSYFVSKVYYAESPDDADVILFNSHQKLKDVIGLKMKYQHKVFIHRVGPIFTYARGDKLLDEIIFSINQYIADATIFQSRWSQNTSHRLGIKKNDFETIIINAPDSSIFYPPGNKQLPVDGRKIKIITTGWAPNQRKGFDIYKFLDENLDFNKYEFTFVGRSIVDFKGIEHIPPQTSERVAHLLKENDIFITASTDDACSNSLIEALHCGLPAVVRNSGGHPEIIGRGGITFEGKNDVMDAINRVGENLDTYRKSIDLPSIDAVGKSYYDFCERVYKATQNKEYIPKNYDFLKNFVLNVLLYQWKCVNLYRGFKDGMLKILKNQIFGES